MPAFELVQPNSINDAQRVLEQQGDNGWVLAGGMDSFDWLKDRIKKPKVVVDLSGIGELKGVRTTADGIEIGAMTTLTEVVQHPVIREKYQLLKESAELVASPQIRNQGTLGGNVSPALIALDARFVIRTSKGERVVDAEDYFIGPQIDITRLHILKPGDLLTAIRIPSTWAGAQFYFEKVRDRNVWDFPLLNVASAMVVSNGSIERMRIAVNGAAARPLRMKVVEDAVRGKPPNASTGEMAGKLAVQGAVPLQFNAYKVPLMRNLVKRAIGGVQEATWTS
jgi:xanthine dehydrogenase YagS FAD-binding subunit